MCRFHIVPDDHDLIACLGIKAPGDTRPNQWVGGIRIEIGGAAGLL